MNTINAYSIDIAIDSYRAKNGKENEIKIFQDGLTRFEYGTERFSSREQAIEWLKSQTSDHEAIHNYIANTRKENPNSNLEELFRTYESYYTEKQNVISTTANQIQSVNPKTNVETQNPKTSLDAATVRSELSFDKTLELLDKSRNLFIEFGENEKKFAIDFANNDGIKIRRANEVFGVIIPTTFEGKNIAKIYTHSDSNNIDIVIDGKEQALNHEEYKNKVIIPALEKFFGTNISATKTVTQAEEVTKTPSESASESKNSSQNPEKARENPLEKHSKFAEKELAKIGKTILDLQIALGSGQTPSWADGIFGAKTLEALKDFQAKNDLIADGFAGPKTLDKLFETPKITSEKSAENPTGSR